MNGIVIMLHQQYKSPIKVNVSFYTISILTSLKRIIVLRKYLSFVSSFKLGIVGRVELGTHTHSILHAKILLSGVRVQGGPISHEVSPE